MRRKRQLPTFVPEKLVEAREARGYTLIELAEKIGISHQAISKYEKGKSKPSFATLEKLAEALSVPIVFFFKSKEISDNRVVFFRSRAAATLKSKKVHLRRIEWLQQIHIYLEKFLEFPKVNIPIINDSTSYVPIDFQDIDEIALSIRKHWGLGTGPISNVLLLLEKQGAIIARASFNDYQIDACSEWAENERPYVFLSSDKTAARSRFDVAHELGHLVLHPYIKQSYFNNKENYKSMEMEANRFASAFLMPASSFGHEVFSTSLDHLIDLKKRWKVSIQAIAYRAYTLGIFSEFQHQYIRRKLAKLNWLKQEPLDAELPYEEPSTLKQAIHLLINHKVKTKSDLITEIGLSREDIEIIANLEPGYLIEDESNTGKVISFKFKNK